MLWRVCDSRNQNCACTRQDLVARNLTGLSRCHFHALLLLLLAGARSAGVFWISISVCPAAITVTDQGRYQKTFSWRHQHSGRSHRLLQRVRCRACMGTGSHCGGCGQVPHQ